MSLTNVDEFSPVWISSIVHLDEFKRIYDESSRWTKYVFGNYRIPEGFPFVKQRIYFWMKSPVVFFSNGVLTVKEDGLTFTANPYRILFGLMNFRNLLSELNFHLKPTDLVTIERYKYPDPPVFGIGKYYNIEWIRIKTQHLILNDDFLICVGGKGPFMGRIRKKTNTLYNTLLEFKHQ